MRRKNCVYSHLLKAFLEHQDFPLLVIPLTAEANER